jgi:hypothetical protein
LGAVGSVLLVRQRRRKPPHADFVMEWMDGPYTVEESASPNGASEKASVVRAGKSR